METNGRKHQSQIAYSQLKEMIAMQELLPGQQIVETSFAEKLGIGRTPMREAIRLLSKDGLVDIIPYKGTFIKSFSKDDVVMGCEVAESLEGMAAFLSAEKVYKGELEIESLSVIQDLMDELDNYAANKDLKAWGGCDEELHDTISEFSGNIFLIEALKRIRTQLNCVLWFITPVAIDKNVSNAAHRRIFESICKGDMYAARNEAMAHRHLVRDEILKLL